MSQVMLFSSSQHVEQVYPQKRYSLHSAFLYFLDYFHLIAFWWSILYNFLLCWSKRKFCFDGVVAFRTWHCQVNPFGTKMSAFLERNHHYKILFRFQECQCQCFTCSIFWLVFIIFSIQQFFIYNFSFVLKMNFITISMK